MSAPTAKRQKALAAFLEAARELGLSRKAQAELLGLPLRTFQQRLKEGRLSPAEAVAAQFLPEALREAEAAFGDQARATLVVVIPQAAISHLQANTAQMAGTQETGCCSFPLDLLEQSRLGSHVRCSATTLLWSRILFTDP